MADDASTNMAAVKVIASIPMLRRNGSIGSSAIVDRIGLFEHARAGDEAGLHSVGDRSSGRVGDLELWQHLDRLIGKIDARMDMRSRSVNRTSTSSVIRRMESAPAGVPADKTFPPRGALDPHPRTMSTIAMGARPHGTSNDPRQAGSSKDR